MKTTNSNTRRRAAPGLPLDEPVYTNGTDIMPPSKSVNGRQGTGPKQKRAPARSPSEIRDHWNTFGPVELEDVQDGSVEKVKKPSDKDVKEASAAPEPEPRVDVDDNGLSKKDKATREVFRAQVEAQKKKIIADFEAQNLDPPLDLEERAMKKVYGHTNFNTDLLFPFSIHGGFEATSNQHYEFKRHLPKDMEDELNIRMLIGRIRAKRAPGDKDDLITGDDIWTEQELLERERIQMGIDEKDLAATEDVEDDAEEKRMREQQKPESFGYSWEARSKVSGKEFRAAGREKRDEQRARAKQIDNDDVFGKTYDDEEDDNTPPEPQLIEDEKQTDCFQRFFTDAITPSTITDDMHVVHVAYESEAVGEILKRLDPLDDNMKVLDAGLTSDGVRSTFFVGHLNRANDVENETLIINGGDDTKTAGEEGSYELWQGKTECHEFFKDHYAIDPYNMACMAIFYDDGRFAAFTVGTEHGGVDEYGQVRKGCEARVIDFGAELARVEQFAWHAKKQPGYLHGKIDPRDCANDLIQVLLESGLRPEMPAQLQHRQQEETQAETQHDAQDEAEVDLEAALMDEFSKDDDDETTPASVTSEQPPAKSTKRSADEADMDDEELTRPEAKKTKTKAELALPPAPSGAYSADEVELLSENLDRTYEKPTPEPKPFMKPGKRKLGEVRDDLASEYGNAKRPKILPASDKLPNGINVNFAGAKGKAKGKGKYQKPAAADADKGGNELPTQRADGDDSDGDLILTNPSGNDDNVSEQPNAPKPRSRKPQTQAQPQLTASGRVSKKDAERGRCLVCNSVYYVTRNSSSTQCSSKKCPGYAKLKARKDADKAAKKEAAKSSKGKSKKRKAADDNELDEERKMKKLRSQLADLEQSLVGEKAMPLDQSGMQAPSSTVGRTLPLGGGGGGG